MTDIAEKRKFIESLARENQKFYNTQDGRGALRALDLTFEHRWIYLFELVQNALDADAKSIAFRLAEDNDALTCQHDGTKELNKGDVEGLSKIFRSTKGASSVGFMGIGFKSIFKLFGEVRISGWDWTFRYEMRQERGEMYGDVQPDLIGAVTPIWDDTIDAPEVGFTTRFEMRDPTEALRSDLERFLPDDDRTLLAILAESGLKRLEVDGHVWELGIHKEPDGSLEATALSTNENGLWQLFPVKFNPSPKAIAHFLEHRRIQPTEEEREQVYAAAARPRRVLGVLPLDNEGVPKPPKRGRVYATLPTEVKLPFGLHINADWLLNISRTGIPEIEANDWQRGIVDQIADVLVCFLCWVARTFSKPDRADRAKAAFATLAQPTPELGDLEALLAEPRWLSRLRDRLEDAAVLPMWTEETGALAFAKPSQIIVPPAPLAETFKQYPALIPTVLLNGSVLREDVLGSNARRLLVQAGLIAEMSPRDLADAWATGLENWWKVLPDDETKRRDLLFCIWGAVSKIADRESWSDVDLPCVRTADGTWRSVNETAFFNEPLPSKREPGGDETRQFIQPFFPKTSCRLPEGWIAALRQKSSKEREDGDRDLSQALNWINNHAKNISLREVIEVATTALASSPTPDWSALVPLGHWAMHRNRPDLLTYVHVESETGQFGVPVSEALLADPYVERGQCRRHLFPTKPTVSAAYLEQDPKNANQYEWRDFSEKAGVQGAIRVQTVKSEASQRGRYEVAKFLRLEEIGRSNNKGYTMLDFDIEEIPGEGASKEVRAAVAAWLEDGFNALRGKGYRKAEYSYYGSCSRTGTRPSKWVIKLSKLAWVPRDDGELSRPQDVLSNSDPAREDVSVAKLSRELLAVLQEEGVAFGTAIPEATLVHRLSKVGSQLDAEELAELLGNIREQIATDEDEYDSEQFEQVVRELAVPLSNGDRIPINRVVQRVGGPRRGTLSGWVLPLKRIDEVLRKELEHPDFPYEFPDTTTGEQALAYIRDVWARARSSPERLANEVRDVLPTAYAYCLKDRVEDDSLSNRWDAAVSDAAVFAEGKWVFLDDAENIYFDDLEDRRFIPKNTELQIVTGGHLGNSLSERKSTAAALGLPCLSSSIEMKWNETGEKEDTNWSNKFTLICKLLHQVRSERVDGGDKTEVGQAKHLRQFKNIELTVKVGDGPDEQVLVNARLDHSVLKVAGRPIQFGSDAAKELLRDYSFRQRGDLAADLTGMLGAIDSEEDFRLAADKFKRSFALDFELPSGVSGLEKPVDLGNDLTNTGNANEPTNTNEKTIPDNGEPYGAGGSWTRDRALAEPKARARELKDALKGEFTPKKNVGIDQNLEAEEGESEGGLLGDEIYREVAMQYERELGRAPELGGTRQEGWDIRSVDPETGLERLIEVKGKGRPWEGDEVVELSRAQVRKAFEMSEDQATGSWYLYVVERIADSTYQVLPIENPARISGKWMLSGEAWRMVAEKPRQIQR